MAENDTEGRAAPYPSFECTIGYDADVPCVIMTWKGYATSREFREANERILAQICCGALWPGLPRPGFMDRVDWFMYGQEPESS